MLILAGNSVILTWLELDIYQRIKHYFRHLCSPNFVSTVCLGLYAFTIESCVNWCLFRD